MKSKQPALSAPRKANSCFRLFSSHETTAQNSRKASCLNSRSINAVVFAAIARNFETIWANLTPKGLGEEKKLFVVEIELRSD